MPQDPAGQPAAPELRAAVLRLARRLRQERHDDQLTPSQLAVLGTLIRSGPLTPSGLAAAEHVQPPSMTRIIAALEQGGWVRRTPHPQDRRQVLIEISDQGRAWIAVERERRDEWLQERLERLDPLDLDAVRRAIPLLESLADRD